MRLFRCTTQQCGLDPQCGMGRRACVRVCMRRCAPGWGVCMRSQGLWWSCALQGRGRAWLAIECPCPMQRNIRGTVGCTPA